VDFSEIKLAIATPFYMSQGFTPYMMSLDVTMGLCNKLGITAEFMVLNGDSYIQRAKNTLLTRFHQAGTHTHLLMVDSDMSWNADAVVKMLMLGKELVGGAYPVKNNWGSWGCQIRTDERGVPEGDPVVPIIRANFIPGGFLMLSVAAVDRMVKAYPEMRYWSQAVSGEGETEAYSFFECTLPMCSDGKRRFQGEDVTFCKRFTAAGGEIWIYPDINFGHYGFHTWEGNYHSYLKSLPGGVNDPTNLCPKG
jgi:hypothetical protein